MIITLVHLPRGLKAADECAVWAMAAVPFGETMRVMVLPPEQDETAAFEAWQAAARDAALTRNLADMRRAGVLYGEFMRLYDRRPTREAEVAAE